MGVMATILGSKVKRGKINVQLLIAHRDTRSKKGSKMTNESLKTYRTKSMQTAKKVRDVLNSKINS